MGSIEAVAQLPVGRALSFWGAVFLVVSSFIDIVGGASLYSLILPIKTLMLLALVVIAFKGLGVNWLIKSSVFWLFGLYFCIYLLSTSTVSGIGVLVQILISFGVFLFAVRMELSNKVLFYVFLLTFLAGMLLFLVFFSFGLERSKNAVGGAVLYFFLISLLARVFMSKAQSYFRLAGWCFFLSATLFLIDYRGGVLEVIVFFFVFFLVCKFGFIVRFPLLIFFGVLSSVFLIIMFYVAIDDVFWFYTIADFFEGSTGRTAKSGRQFIWPFILELVSERPVFGYGSSALFKDFSWDHEWSAHNFYLQVLLQVGFLGISILVALLYSIFNEINHYCLNLGAGVAAFGVVVVHNALEVALMQNLFAVGVLQWFMLGLCANRYLFYRR